LKIGTAFEINALSITRELAFRQVGSPPQDYRSGFFYPFIKVSVMSNYGNKMAVFFMIGVGSVIGMVRGEQAKQKWVFRVRSKHDDKRLTAEKRQQARKGGVLLDDIEMASYH